MTDIDSIFASPSSPSCRYRALNNHLPGLSAGAARSGDSAKKWLALASAGHFCGQPGAAAHKLAGRVRAEMQFVEDVSWFAPLGIRYALGVDGISLFLVLLTTLLMPIAVYFSNLYVHEASARTWR
jgi:NADH:ubiquinone oxidoreductase subunit 4 (subunit M)